MGLIVHLSVPRKQAQPSSPVEQSIIFNYLIIEDTNNHDRYYCMINCAVSIY